MTTTDPTPAEIEAGARVLDQWEHYVAADSAHVAELVLRAVLPAHDARLRAELESCVWIDPGRMGGEPCVGGTRVTVASVAAVVGDGGPDTVNPDRVHEFWPGVSAEGAQAAVWWTRQQADRDRQVAAATLRMAEQRLLNRTKWAAAAVVVGGMADQVAAGELEVPTAMAERDVMVYMTGTECPPMTADHDPAIPALTENTRYAPCVDCGGLILVDRSEAAQSWRCGKCGKSPIVEPVDAALATPHNEAEADDDR